MKVLFLWFLIAIHFCSSDGKSWRPVVLIHGLLAGAEAMSHSQKWIESDYPGIYIHNVEIGNGRTDSLTWDMNIQVEYFAKAVQSDPKLKNGFNLIGHSQGGILARAFIERYNNPPVYNYISWAGPHGGQYGVPAFNAYCPDELCPWLNDIFDQLLEDWVSNIWLQDFVSFATYWKDPFAYDAYLQFSHLLSDINNEKPQKNSTYRKNIMSLNYMLLIYSTVDNIVIPMTAPLFEHFRIGQDVEVVSFRNTDQYKQDFLGLKTLDKAGKIELQGIPCGHQDIPRDICKEWYVLYTRRLLNNTI